MERKVNEKANANVRIENLCGTHIIEPILLMFFNYNNSESEPEGNAVLATA
jgi:hypothetical protein